VGRAAPGVEHDLGPLVVRTLDRPPGERLATVATMNDVHFGETACGVVEGTDIGPVLRSEPGEEPYPQLMNRAPVAEVLALGGGSGPDAVVVKGDLTAEGTEAEYEAFLECYAPLGDRCTTCGATTTGTTGATFAAVPTAGGRPARASSSPCSTPPARARLRAR
jgi:hypothetical protein